MPRNKELNMKFGVYKSVCCGAEIAISVGMAFPDCPNHLNLTTEWKSVVDEKIRHVTELSGNEKKDSSAA